MAATEERAAVYYRWQVKRGYVYYGPGNRTKNATERVSSELKFTGTEFVASDIEVEPEKYKLSCLGERRDTDPLPAKAKKPKRGPQKATKILAVDTGLDEPPETT